jgi:protoheme IX farnesyltransferase
MNENTRRGWPSKTGIALTSFCWLRWSTCWLYITVVYFITFSSIFLKKTTVQNIVIGGGAGAIPPLVGWAAATGSLNIPSLLLFAIVFMWTPPHFWALALVRRRDYARAGVPMLPVVRGEKETRRQILLYTVELVALTLLLPLIGLGGSVYLVGAAALGGSDPGCIPAWKIGQQAGLENVPLLQHVPAFIFLVLMIVVEINQRGSVVAAPQSTRQRPNKLSLSAMPRDLPVGMAFDLRRSKTVVQRKRN